MAYAIVHFLVGASVLLVLAIPLTYRVELGEGWPLWLVAVGGMWGLVPDLHHIAPVAAADLYAAHDSPWADLFAFHHTLDRPYVRARYVESVFGSLLGFLGAVTAFTLAMNIRKGGAAETSERRSPAPMIAVGSITLVVGIVLGALLYATIG